MIIKFNSDDDLSLSKSLKFHLMTIIIISVFEEDRKLYPQLFFRWYFVWVSVKMLQYEKIDASKRIDVNKTSASKNVSFVTIAFLNWLDSNLKNMFVMDVMIY